MTENEWQFVEVPPPSKAPVDGVAATLGLCDGLRADQTDRQYRCASCSEMQPAGWLVWVPDSVRRGDPAWSVTESARLHAYNGGGSGWCVRCARSFKNPKSAVSATEPLRENAPKLRGVPVIVPLVENWFYRLLRRK